MEHGMVLVWLIVTILLILVMIMKFKLNAAVAMFIASMFMGVINGVGWQATVKAITGGFGNTMASIGMSIGFGVILGQLVSDTGAVQVIADTMLKVFGEKRADTALGCTGFIVSIPVFFDVGFVILMPLAKALAQASKTKKLPTFIVALGAGLCVAHCFIPPTPGPLAAAELMSVSVGTMIAFGVIIGFPTFIITCLIYNKIILNIPGYWNPETCQRALSAEEEAALEAQRAELMKDRSKLPGFGASLVPIFLPIVLILIGTVMAIFTEVPDIINAIASKEVAMLIGVFAAMLLCKGRLTQKEVEHSFNVAMEATGLILLITGMGGALGNVLTVAGVGTALNELMEIISMPPMIFTWMVGVIIRLAQGSGTVAMITAVGIVATMGDLGVAPVWLTLAACSGAMFCGHLNDSGYWVVTNVGGLTVEGGLKTYSVYTSICSVVLFLIVFVLSMFF